MRLGFRGAGPPLQGSMEAGTAGAGEASQRMASRSREMHWSQRHAGTTVRPSVTSWSRLASSVPISR